jgi:hypothetical protein
MNTHVILTPEILTSLLILPKGTVKNEGIFFAMLIALIALIAIAVILRKRGGKEESMQP